MRDLTPLDALAVAEVQTVTTTAGADDLDGTFTLSFGGQTTSALAKDASAADVTTALNALSTVSGAAVARGAKTADNGYVYTVRFAAGAGDVALLECGKASLTGTAPACAVAEATKVRRVVLVVVLVLVVVVVVVLLLLLLLTSCVAAGQDRRGECRGGAAATERSAHVRLLLVLVLAVVVVLVLVVVLLLLLVVLVAVLLVLVLLLLIVLPSRRLCLTSPLPGAAPQTTSDSAAAGAGGGAYLLTVDAAALQSGRWRLLVQVDYIYSQIWIPAVNS